MKKIKVLQFSVSNGKGGRTQAVLENWKFINKQMFQFDFVALKEPLEFQEDIEKAGGEVYYLSCTAEENPQQFIEELGRIFTNHYDVIHIHSACWKSFLVNETARQFGIPKIIIHSHNTDVSKVEDVDLMKRMEQQHYQLRNMLTPEMATDFWACSPAASRWMFADQIPKEQIRIVKDAIDVKRFAYDSKMRERCRKRLGIGNQLVIGHIGRFSYQKNQEYLVDLFCALKQERENVILLMEGVGKLKNRVVAKVNAMGLHKDVIFVENYEKIEELYQVMDVFVFPSLFEGFGRVLLEAQCSGLKCISSDQVPSDVKVTSNVEFLPLENISEWIDWIKAVTPYKREDMSECIKESGFDIIENVKNLERLYQL